MSTPPPDRLAPYDGILLLSFGGPEKPDDVIPFLENVTRGRGIPPQRLTAVAEHYLGFGGRSPINDENRRLLAGLRAELDRRGLDLPLYWGNRNWEPYLVDTLRQAHDAGARRLAVVVTSAYASYSGCRQYREDLADALAALAAQGRRLEVKKIRHYFNHPGFVDPAVDGVVAAFDELPVEDRSGSRVIFVTHSVPIAMNEASGPDGGAYVRQHLDVAETVAGRAGAVLGRRLDWDLAYCSRSGPPHQPWLEPDINDRLEVLHAAGVPGVVVVPIGFVSDHMEVVYDLDTEANATASGLGLSFVRVATAGADPRFAGALVDLVVELGEAPEVCPVGCCRNPRGDRPAACGADWAGVAAAR